MIRQFKLDGNIIYAFDLEQAKTVYKERFPIHKNKVNRIEEIDYNKSFTYFPINEIKIEDEQFIYDWKSIDSDEPIASLPLSIARKYPSYLAKLPKHPLVTSVYH